VILKGCLKPLDLTILSLAPFMLSLWHGVCK
jgi:hypothetical protein